MKKKIVYDGIEFDYYIYSNGKCQNGITGNFLKGSISPKGYRTYYLRKGKIQKNISAHRLVAQAFLENPNNLEIVHHKDSDKLNNDVSNLQWVSSSENAKEIGDVPSRRNKRPPYEYYTGDLPNEKWATYRNTHLKFSNLGRLLNTETNRILKMHVGNDLYCYYSPKLDGKTKKVMAHRGVYESFNGVELSKEQQIDHIDGNRQNNCLDNLRLVTAQENCQYRSDRMTEQRDYVIGQFDDNEHLIAYYLTGEKAAQAVGCSGSSISSAIKYEIKTKGFFWKKIPKQEVQRLSVMNVAE